jgi:hypothetical protein
MKKIVLPNNWSPRPYQQPLWKYLANGGKRAVVSWHRRSGKDAVMLNHCACAAHERVGNIWYLMPEYSQCRKAVWQAINPHTGKLRLDEAFPMEIRRSTNQQEMSIQLLNGSQFQLIGSDAYDALVGSTPVGLVFSEYALSNPASWSYLRPMLLENNGWAAFNSTPRGKNHFYEMFEMAKKSPNEWFSQVLTADETGVFTPEQLASELLEYKAENGEAFGQAMFKQEYYCSFTSAVLGSYYGLEMQNAEDEGRITKVEYDPAVPVHTAWDLGYSDDTSIWFYQVVGDEIHLIDYHSSNGEAVPYYAGIVMGKPYKYGLHWLPHDARAKTLASGGKSIIEQLSALIGLGNMRICPNLSLQDGIQASRMALKRCWFDAEKTEFGLKCLREYQREYDDERRMLKDKPKHDFTSHGADAFRYMAVAWREEEVQNSAYEEMRGITIGKPSFSLNEMWKTAFRGRDWRI